MDHNPILDYKLSLSSDIPLYAQLVGIIKHYISSGALSVGDLLPSETELCRALRISRNTVRQAIGELEDEGLVVQKRGAADAVLPSKLTNILAVGGNAVITAEAHTELGQLCETFPGIAVCVEPESVEALVAGIRQALLLPKHNTVAREYAERTLDKENVLRQFINDIRG